MIRAVPAFACLLSIGVLPACAQSSPSPLQVGYDAAHAHEIKPHRRTIPTAGIRQGLNQLRLSLSVSAVGDVVAADADSVSDSIQYWPQLKHEVLQWKFAPFVVDGKPVTAKVEEYVDLVPPERFPARHLTPPDLRPDSEVSITLQRTACLGRCPGYTVTVSTTGILFDGESHVAAIGRQSASVDPGQVRRLAARFIAADFYSMDPRYMASVTDNPGYRLSISIDGRRKQVYDYVGQWVGMPAVIKDLEDAVDDLAQTRRWIKPAQ